MKTIPKLPVQACTGCSACAALCPVKAISMAADKEGFLRPVIDEKTCVGCGKCEKHCPIADKTPLEKEPLAAFAAKAAEAEVHGASQSGGVFYVLARWVLQQGGVVYGAALGDGFETAHIRVDATEELKRLQGVKYVQSNPDGCFDKAAADLKSGKTVLYSGTPCQIAGLRSTLRGRSIPDGKLLTADVVCYGVPSPGVFRQWLRSLEKHRRSKVVAMRYRSVDAPWGKGKEWYRFADGTELSGSFYTGLYFRNLIIRPGCESCRFCNTHRPGDVTLGDFWGIADVLPEFDDEKGVSLVLLNTPAGQAAFQQIRHQLESRETPLSAAVAAQPRLQGIAVKRSGYRDSFWEKLRSYGMDEIAVEEGFFGATLGYRLKKKLQAVKQSLRK